MRVRQPFAPCTKTISGNGQEGSACSLQNPEQGRVHESPDAEAKNAGKGGLVMRFAVVVLLGLLISGCTKVDGWNAQEWQEESLRWFDKHGALEKHHDQAIDCVENEVSKLTPETIDQFKYNLRYCY